MLGKLMKYEWNYIYKKFLLFAGLMAVASCVGYFSAAQFSKLDPDSNPLLFMSIMFGLMIYYMILSGVSIGFTIIIGIRFYKTVYGDRGYLTHTLPVSARQIYWSHIIVDGLCQIVLCVLMQLSIMMVSTRMMAALASDITLNASDFYMQMYGADNPVQLLVVIFYSIFGTLVSLIMVFASIVLGQYWKRHKVWGAVVSYLIITTCMMVVSWVTLIPQFVYYVFNNDSPDGIVAIPSFFWISIMLISAVFGVVTFFIMDHGMTKRLNLE